VLEYIKNCRIYHSPEQIVHIALENGLISNIVSVLPENASILLDAKGMIIAPGLIDTHVHGAGGANPSSGIPESIKIMSETLCKMGTTSFTPTTFFNKYQNDHLRIMANYKSQIGEADNLGLHLEGPFIHPKRKGGIPLECIKTPNREILNDLLIATASNLKILTLAPEIPWTEQIISMGIDFNFICSLGHSDANNEQAKQGFKEGISCVTHLNNAMRKYDRDKDHPLDAIVNSGVFTQIIPDGIHLKENEIRHFYELFGPDRLICITDGIDACGLSEGEYDFNGKKYRSENGLAFYSDGSGMIGTTLPLFEILKRFKKFTDCSLADAIKTATVNPAKLLKIDDHKGYIQDGYDADLIVIDDEENLRTVIKSGQLVSRKMINTLDE
jgi:N-acetylglucosamine-6-phosphate deacetylase